MSHTQDIVQKLWNLCHILRDDGITYHQYVTELTYLLFLKMVKETGRESLLPKGYRWDDLETRDGIEQLNFYRLLLVHLGSRGLASGAGDLRQRASSSVTAAAEPREARRVDRRARLVPRQVRGPRRPVRRAPREERRREEERAPGSTSRRGR